MPARQGAAKTRSKDVLGMDMMEFLRTRRTYRRFEQRPVAPEILQECVDAARIASCGANRQTVKYIIVQSPEAVAAVQPLVHWAAYLPREQGTPKADEVPTAFIAVLQDENLPGANDMDAGLALGSLTAAAWAHGVGSCIMGAIDRPALTKLLLEESIDCGIMALNVTEPFSPDQITILREEEVLLAIPASHPYCRKNPDKPIKIEEFEENFGDENILLSKKGSTLRYITDEVLEQAGIQVQIGG